MTPDDVVSIGAQAIYIILLVSGPLLGVGLLVGLLVSVFQATTQIQEQTLAFIPKIVAIIGSLILFGPWMLTHIMDFSHGILSNLYKFIG